MFIIDAMKRILPAVAAAIVALAAAPAFAENPATNAAPRSVVRVDMGRLSIPDVPIEFHAVAHRPDWTGRGEQSLSLEEDGSGCHAFAIRLDGTTFDGRAAYREEDGAVRAEWSLAPDRDTELACLCVSGTLPLSRYAGGVAWRACGIDRDGTMRMDTFKTLVQFHEGAFSNYLAFARSFLGHVNPYTGRRYADEMGCRALLTDMNSWFYPVAYQLPRGRSLDYVDDHFYVDHPRFLEHDWCLPSACNDANPIAGESMGAQGLAVRRLLDRPFTITEWNYAAPGRYRGVGGIATGAAAALQDWAAVWRFAWSHDDRGMSDPAHKPVAYFDMAGDPLSLAAERASLCLLLRRRPALLRRRRRGGAGIGDVPLRSRLRRPVGARPRRKRPSPPPRRGHGRPEPL